MNWRKLLFNLHLTHTYPTYLTGLDGSRVPANIIRTDNVSSDIRPDIKTDGYIKPRPSMIHFDTYTPPKNEDGTITIAHSRHDAFVPPKK